MFQWGGMGWVRWGGVGRGGVGCGNNVHALVHTQARQPHHLSCCPAHTGTAHSWSVTGGLRRGNNVPVLVHTQTQQPYHFPAVQHTQALLIHDQLPVGWGGVITFMMFMFLCTHRRGKLIIFLAVQHTQALLIHDQLPVGWGGAG